MNKIEQQQFLFFTENNNYYPLESKIKNYFYGFVNGFYFRAKLQFKFNEKNNVTGIVGTAKGEKLEKAEKKINPLFIGIEGKKAWQYINSNIGIEKFNGEIVTGINLNLAVIIHNIRTMSNYNNQKPLVALYNVENDCGELLAGIFSAVLGDIVLVGSDREKLKSMAKKYFNEYGVMAQTCVYPYINENALHLDTNSIVSHISKMNYIGNYNVFEATEACSNIFSTHLVETVILAGGLVDTKKYQSTYISAENVSTVAKAAKKAGFLPVFSTIQK